MAKTTLTQEKLKIIKQGISREKNIADLGLKFYLSSLKSFEKKYKMKTKEFLKNFHMGKLGDDQQWFDWLFVYKAYNGLTGHQSLKL